MKARIALLIALTTLMLFVPIPTKAQRILPGTDHPLWENQSGAVVSRRPHTTNFMNNAKAYMTSLDENIRNCERGCHTANLINEWKAEIDANPFYRRVHPHAMNDGIFSSTGDMITHIAQDIWRATDDLLGSCGDISWPNAGFCWKKDCLPWPLDFICWHEDPRPIKSYRLPIQMIEVTEHRGQTGYMLQPINEASTLAGNYVYNFLATGELDGVGDIPLVGSIVNSIIGPVSDLFGDVVGHDVKLSTRLMDTTTNIVGLRDHLYLFGCENLDPTDYTAIVNCIQSRFNNNYKDISDFTFHDSDGNVITENMVKRIRNTEVTSFGGVVKPYENFSERYHNYSDPGEGHRYFEYHLVQPSPYYNTMISLLRNIQLWGVYPFRWVIGQCERNLDDIVYFSEWPFAFDRWDYGTGGGPTGVIKQRVGFSWLPVPTGVVYSRSLGASYMDFVIANRGGNEMKTGHKGRFFDYREFTNPGALISGLANGSHSSSADPYACSRANMRWGAGRTPNDMLYPLTRGDRPPGLPQAPGGLAGPVPGTATLSPGVCGGVNQGSWAPALSRGFLKHGPAGSEQAFVKAIATVRSHPSNRINRRAYRVDLERDRIQWLRDKDMREINEGCHRLGEKAGWEYDREQISKDVDRDGKDDEFWNVALHWKRFRCCEHNSKRCGWELSDLPFFWWCGGDGDLFDIRE